MFRSIFVATVCLLSSTYSFADIHVWTYNSQNCTISDVDNTIQINVAGTYGFRAWNNDPGNPVLQDIQDITINSAVTGAVTVRIAYSSAGGDGAEEIKAMDLKTGASTGRLMVLRCSGAIGRDAPIKADVLAAR